ncbi:MAG: hypothetical protein AAF841_04425, partial [Pseudomonadota bacterium]
MTKIDAQCGCKTPGTDTAKDAKATASFTDMYEGAQSAEIATILKGLQALGEMLKNIIALSKQLEQMNRSSMSLGAQQVPLKVQTMLDGAANKTGRPAGQETNVGVSVDVDI